MLNIYELKTKKDGCKSFYNKANILIINNIKILMSYNSYVAMIKDDKIFIDFDLLTKTTLRHVKGFLFQEKNIENITLNEIKTYFPYLSSSEIKKEVKNYV